MGMLRLFSKVMPKEMRKKYRKKLRYSTLTMHYEEFIGYMIIVGILGGVSGYIVDDYFKMFYPAVSFFPSFFITAFLVDSLLGFNISAKASSVEEVLPDALQLMSSNIRAGMTLDKALLMAARPEFGPLEVEIKRVGKETMAGRDLIDAISRMSDHIRSDDLDRTIELIVHSLKSGGQLADLLDQSADDLREQQLIRKEISASVLMYVMFIFIAISIGAPLLFAMSSFLVELLTTNMDMIASELPQDFENSGSMPISMEKGNIDISFIKNYAVVSLTLSSVFGSLIMGLILKGEEKEGIKFMLPVIIIALGLYFAGSYVLDYTIGGMMPRN